LAGKSLLHTNITAFDSVDPLKRLLRHGRMDRIAHTMAV